MNDSIWLRDVLASVRLESYFLKFKDADITLPEHFDHVTPTFLGSIGLSEPAQRRLLDAVKKEKKRNKKNLKKYGKQLPTLNYNTPSVKTIDQRGAIIQQSALKEGKTLGDGSFGIVVEGLWSSNGRSIAVAIKTLKLGDEADKNAIYDFFEEISVMAELDHKYLLPLYGIVLSQPLKLVMKLAPGGSLQTRLRKQKDFSVLRVCEFSVQIAKGMEYLSSKKFVHRDLALRNILLYNENEIKVGDFGLMRRLQGDTYYMAENRKIPIAWSSLESLTKRIFSEKTDVWSFGVCVWEMFNYGQSPWHGTSAFEIIKKLKDGERLAEPGRIPTGFWENIKRCWNKDPTSRPSFAKLVERLSDFMPEEVEVFTSCSMPDCLKVRSGDTVYIIKNKGDVVLAQNSSSLAVGGIPARILGRAGTIKLLKTAISAPVENSFIHASHGDGKGGTSWGNATFIDSAILDNPIVPSRNAPLAPAPTPRPTIPESDLLGSMKKELADRPVFQCRTFADLHNKIGEQLKKPDYSQTDDLVIYDSFESSSDDDRRADSFGSFRSNPTYNSGLTTQVASTQVASNMQYYNQVYQVTPDSDSDEVDELSRELELLDQMENTQYRKISIDEPSSDHYNPEFVSPPKPTVNHFEVNFPKNVPVVPSYQVMIPTKVTRQEFPNRRNGIYGRPLTPQPIHTTFPQAARSLTPNPPSPTKKLNFNPFNGPISTELKSLQPNLFDGLDDLAFSWFKNKEKGDIYAEDTRSEFLDPDERPSSPNILPLNTRRSWVEFNSPTRSIPPSFFQETDEKDEKVLHTLSTDSLPDKPLRNNLPIDLVLETKQTKGNITPLREQHIPPLELVKPSLKTGTLRHEDTPKTSLPKRSKSVTASHISQKSPAMSNSKYVELKQNAVQEPQYVSKIAFMSTSDAVSTIRQKYQKSEAKPPQQPQQQNTFKDIFAIPPRRLSEVEQKSLDLKVATLLKKCPFANESSAKEALDKNSMDSMKAVKYLKIQRLFQLAPENICHQALQRANNDPDRALKILQSQAT